MRTDIKQGDTGKVIGWVVTGSDGQPLDLTGATPTIVVKLRGSASIELAAVVADPPTAGRVQHTLTGTLAPGLYQGEVRLSRTGVQETSPTNGTFELEVEARIP